MYLVSLKKSSFPHVVEGGLHPARRFSAASEEGRFSLASAPRDSSPARTKVRLQKHLQWSGV
jgi:hypothetical protein